MTREKDDPEKRNLLTEQKEDKKRRQYSGSRTKMDRRSCESSSSEHRKRGGVYKTSSTEQRAEFKQTRPQSVPYQSEKKDSWWFWQKDQNQNQKNQKETEDTCSCVSCADLTKRQEKAATETAEPCCDFGKRDAPSLKRIVSSEYACIGCLLLLFTISIIVAFLVVFKSVPSIAGGDTQECHTSSTTAKPKPKSTDSERLKRKIEMLNDNRMNSELSGVDEYHKSDKKGYGDALPGNLGASSEIGIDFGPSFRELNSLDESDSKVSGDMDWTSMLEADKTIDVQSSEKLREFYKKLVQTDAKIKSLKKINPAAYTENEESVLKSPERSKRSLKLYSYPKRYHVIKRRRIFNKDQKVKDGIYMKRRSNKTRIKRLHNDSEEPTGFVIEKKKLIVQYKPAGVRKKIPVKKCSHAPKDSHTHENQLKHPFYQNTQRLDELLDRFLNKNLPEIMSDPFGLDSLFKHDKGSKCKHPNPTKNVDIIAKDALVDQIPKPKGKSKKLKVDMAVKETQPAGDVMKLLRPETSTQYEKDFYHHEVQMIGKEKQKVVTASPNDFEVLLSVSTIMNPDVKKTGSKLPTVSLLDKVPKLRRLMQLEVEDEENLGYEDFKEVLTDDTENHDELDKRADRKKRRDEEQWPSDKAPKYNPPGVHNPNWKGPMPLYPDELNSMIRHAALNANKVEIPSSSNDLQSEFLERRGRDLSDVEYVEDYLRNKYDQLVEMAQAYSDYGVLDGKKDSRNDKNSASDSTATDHRIKLAVDENNNAGLLGRLKKDRVQSFVTTPAGSIRRQRDATVTTEIEETTEQTGGSSNTMNLTIPHTSEGIRFEIRPTTKSRDDDLEVLKILQKHVKIEPKLNIHPAPVKPNPIHSTLISSYPDVELVYSTKPDLKPKPGKFEPKKTYKNSEDTEKENGLLFSVNRGRRNLLSTDFKRAGNFRNNKDTTGDWGASPNRNKSAIEKFVQNLNIKRYNLTNEKALSRYIERVKQKNIRIFSTAHPDFTKKTTSEFSEDSLSTIAPFRVFKLGHQSLLNDTIVTIKRSEMKMDEYTGNNFLGKILLTVRNPDIGEEHIDLNFDLPLAINWHDELMMMSDNIKYPNIYNQFEIYTDSSIEQNDQNEQNESDIELDLGPAPDEGTIDNRTAATRYRRDVTLFNNAIQLTTTETSTHPASNITSNNSIHFNVSVSSRSMNRSEPDMTLSDFFMMVSDWFKALEGSKVDKPRSDNGSDLAEMLLTLNSSENQSTTDTVYPIYDSDMIENIGHRSRVLLSIENLENNTDVKRETGDMNVTRVKKTESAGGNVSNTTNSSTPITNLNINITTPKKETNKKTKEQKSDSKTKVKTIIKRNAEDSNLIFWNDIYDDEYGIQTDKFDNSIRDKHSVKENDFIKRSGRWVHDKIKKFADNLKINPRTEDMALREREPRSMKEVPRSMKSVPRHLGRVPRSKRRVARTMSRVPRSRGRLPRSVRYPRFSTYPKYVYDRMYSRFTRKEPGMEEEDYDMDQKSIFTALSSNMKDVCKKAARAVQQTRNIEGIPSQSSKTVREDTKQGSIATSLMQQLVRLLTDLVDYQVQQKTCTRLPADLQSFLEWLTFPRDEVQDSQSETLTFKTPFQEEDLIEELEMQNGDDKTTDHGQETASQPSMEKPTTTDLRLHYMECLHSVQELLDQYEEMADEDKSKMTGVKNYLENQIRFLNKQLSGYDLFTLFEKHQSMRYKRDLTKKPHLLKRRLRRRLNKFMKNFGKKHTRTTASFYDGVQVTDMKRQTVTNNRIDVKIDNDFDEKVSNDVKRNLKDVYYKAIAEAKKYATAKNDHKKEEITHFKSTTGTAKQ